GSRAVARCGPMPGSRLQASGTPRSGFDAARGEVELTRVLGALVEAARAFAPELDAVAPEPIAAPERRPRHEPRPVRIVRRIAAEFRGLRVGAQREVVAVLERLALRADPRVQLAAERAGREVGIAFGIGRAHDAALEPDLPPEMGPIERGRGPRVAFELPSLARAIVRVEHDVAVQIGRAHV